jgi:hypothetical protein
VAVAKKKPLPHKVANPHFLSPRKLEEFEERAAIMEFCGNLPREEAERRALEEVQKPRRPAPGED